MNQLQRYGFILQESMNCRLKLKRESELPENNVYQLEYRVMREWDFTKYVLIYAVYSETKNILSFIFNGLMFLNTQRYNAIPKERKINEKTFLHLSPLHSISSLIFQIYAYLSFFKPLFFKEEKYTVPITGQYYLFWD